MDLPSDFEFGFPTTLDFVNPPPEWSQTNPAYFEHLSAGQQQQPVQSDPSDQPSTSAEVEERAVSEDEDQPTCSRYVLQKRIDEEDPDPFSKYFPDFNKPPSAGLNVQSERSPMEESDLEEYIEETSPPPSETSPATTPSPARRASAIARKSKNARREESPTYRERRDKNNEASKMSRQRRQSKFKELKEEAVVLERRNLQLRTTLEGLEREVRDYKAMLERLMKK